MEIPKRFKIANHVYTISIQDLVFDDDGNSVYGLHDEITCEIKIATSIKRGDKILLLKDEQVKNTVWHELFHVFNFFWNNEHDESLAQTFANFMREYEETRQY